MLSNSSVVWRYALDGACKIEGRYDMKQLFDALREKHAGYDVVDLRLLANAQEVNGRQASELDGEFAVSVREAVSFDPSTMR